MIGKLRIKLIIASMCSLLIVLAVILSVSGILSYRKLTSDADSLLAILAENGGNFPKREHPAEEPLPRPTGTEESAVFLLSCPMS